MKNFTSMLLIMATLFISLPVYSVSVWDGTAEMWTVGSGTESDPYQIQTAQNLAYLARSVNSGNSYSGKFFIQTDDIDLNSIEWAPIGGQYDYETHENSYFDASFDGANHLISNVKISGVGDGTYGVGLFGYCKGGGALKNINATVDVNFSNSNSIGGIVGYSEVPMVNCSARGTINYSSVGVGTGGVAGYSGSEMSLCINYCDITGDGSSAVGGVVGRANHGGGLSYCTNYGDIKSELGGYYYFGGVVAECDGNINGCVNYGDVSGAYYCSGVVVYASSSNSTISLCKNFGNITAGYENNQERSYATGVVYSSSGDVKDCVNYGNVSSNYESCGIANMAGGIIEKCSNHGAVSAISTQSSDENVYASGINMSGNISDCYNTGTITATSDNPDAVSHAYGCSRSGQVSNTYNAGKLIGDDNYGLVDDDESVTNSFYLESCGGSGAGISISSEQMQSSSFIEALDTEGGAVFVSDVDGINNGYPILYLEQTFNVVFKNYDGAVLQSEKLLYDNMPVYKGQTPIRQSDAQYSYSFSGWNPAITPVTSDQIYIAQFSTVNKYTVRFLNEDGTELQSEELEYGTVPVYTGETPTKDATAQYTYTFNGWDSEIEKVTGAKDYTATYSSTVNKYLINFENYDGTELQSKEVSYGDTPVYTGETPSRPSTVQYTYTFIGWDSEIVAVDESKTYTAQFSSTVNKYLITFENYDGTELQSKEVSYGDTPVYTGVTPVKPSTAQYTYSFNGWDSEIVAVDESKTYTAQYSSTVNKYVIRFLNEDGTELQSEELEYGTIPVYKGETPGKQSTAQYTYTFNGWDSEIGKVTGAKDYIATYSSTINKYLITFENYNGDELQSGEVEYGQTPAYTGATPEKPADAEFTYTFSGWSPDVVSVVGAQTYTAQFSSTVNKYVIRFLNEDGTELQNEELDYGVTPVYKGTEPSKAATKQYSYTFAGWNNTIVPVDGAKDYTAIYSSTVNRYLITFENYDGTELQRKEVSYGDTPVYTGATPVRPSTAQYTYNFTGWDSEIVAVDETKTYTAQFSSTVNKYTVRFLNEDGTELQSEELEYGVTPVYKGTEPSKAATKQYSYTFAGWNNTIVPVDGAKDYTATYSSTVNRYLITFENYDGTELQRKEVSYGDAPVYTGATPVRPSTAQYTYNFTGWDSEIVAVDESKTYTAQFSSTVNKYTVRFLNEDGTELQSEELEYGTIPVYKGETPGKQSTAQYTYTFNGWDSEIEKVTGAKDYTATYSSTVNKYLITFENYDGTELQSKGVSYGDTPVYTGETPSRPSTAQYTYTFNGWDSEIVAVDESKTYTAQFSSTVNKYVIRFLNEDGTELQSEELEYGTIPVYKGETPTKQPTAQYTYTFNGWDSEIGKVTGVKNYTATYSSTVNKYLITFENYNGTELQSSEVKYGQIPAYTGATPEKPADAEFTYTFSGWSPEVVAVVGTQTYTAQFNSTVNKYVIRFLNEDGTELQNEELDYGTIPVYKGETPTKQPTAQYTYTFNGWDSEIGTVTGAKDYIATYSSTINKYLITFENYNGDELQSGEVEYGQTPAYTGATPVRPSTAQYTYNFTGWDSEIVAVDESKTYTAQFSSTVNKYTVRFLNEDGTELQNEELEYGAIPVYAGETPTKQSTAQYTYTFNGWDSEIGKVTGAKDYTATYSSIVNKYLITFENYNGDELQSGEVEYGQIPSYTGATPEKPADAEFTHTFSGWSPEVVAVVGAQTYTAQYSSTVNKYIVRFLNEDGTELQSEELDYGTIPVYTGEIPTKDATAQYTYTFNGWDSEIGKVTGAKDYTATYSSIVNKYLITFENYNGDELQSGEVEYGQIPSYTGATPEKPADAEFTYTFSGWSPEVVAVVGAQTYTAQYSSTVNKYTVRFLNEDGTELQSEELDYGTIPVYTGEIPTKDATAQYTYTFNGWDSEIGKVTGAKDYTATYSSIVNKYTVTLSGINCDVTGDGVYDYGTIVELNAIPNDGYVFQNWSDGNTDNPRTIVVDRDYDISVKLCKTSFETISATIFKGDYYEFGDRHLTQRGTYTETFLNKAGCDSVVVLTLSVIPVPTYNVRLSVYKDDTWGSVTGDGTYRKGTTATLNALPASGYKFSYWYDQDTQERFYENPLSLVVERAVSLTASFSRAPKIKVTYGQRSAEVEGDGEEDVISYVVSTKQHVDIDNVGSRSILIYSTAGQIMLRQVNVEHYEGHLPSGVYIINIDGVIEKFVVR